VTNHPRLPGVHGESKQFASLAIHDVAAIGEPVEVALASELPQFPFPGCARCRNRLDAHGHKAARIIVHTIDEGHQLAVR